jgi:hypothetical protein
MAQFDIHKWRRKNLTESKIKSDIMTKWSDADTVEKDLVNFVDEAYAAGGEDLVKSLAYVFQGMTEYIETGEYMEGQAEPDQSGLDSMFKGTTPGDIDF